MRAYGRGKCFHQCIWACVCVCVYVLVCVSSFWRLPSLQTLSLQSDCCSVSTELFLTFVHRVKHFFLILAVRKASAELELRLSSGLCSFHLFSRSLWSMSLHYDEPAKALRHTKHRLTFTANSGQHTQYACSTLALKDTEWIKLLLVWPPVTLWYDHEHSESQQCHELPPWLHQHLRHLWFVSYVHGSFALFWVKVRTEREKERERERERLCVFV